MIGKDEEVELPELNKNFNEIHDWGEQKAALALSHRGTPEVPHPPTKKKKKKNSIPNLISSMHSQTLSC